MPLLVGAPPDTSTGVIVTTRWPSLETTISHL